MVTALMYVSRSCLPKAAAAFEVDRIVEHSVARNQTLEIRGALIFTERHFAQVIEGPKQSIDALMASILRDRRHADVSILSEAAVDDYRFPNWTLAYRGGASYMDQQVAALMRPQDADRQDEAARLYFLIRKLAIESQDGGPIGRPSPQ